MSPDTLLKGFFALIFCATFGWMIFDRDEQELSEGDGRQRYLPYIPGGLLPGVLLGLVLLAVVCYGPGRAATLMLDAFFGIIVQICAYNVLLLLLLPLLRRRFSARACAVLWMLPNYLYVTVLSFARVPGPALVLRAPGRLAWYLLAVWIAGFLAVLGWKCVSHLVFRRRILKDAAPVTDPSMLAVWQAELDAARFKKPKFRLVSSPAVTTPLSIGLFRRSTRVVLPRRGYTEAELHLLLRHELVHIGREDANNKFFMVFCTALCWFNPLMWLAARKSADDLELSCDETVLLDADGETKRQYAQLLLNTAGDERGFTSCLSASAAALRYRLKNAVDPKKKRGGALLVGLVFFLLFMSCGYVALAYGGDTGAELLFHGAPEDATLMFQCVIREDGSQYYNGTMQDGAALMDYLSGLELCRLTGNYPYSVPTGQRGYGFSVETPMGMDYITLWGNTVKLTHLHGKHTESRAYYVPDGVDTAFLESILA